METNAPLFDFAPIDEAISTVGGISLDEISQNLELKKRIKIMTGRQHSLMQTMVQLQVKMVL